MSAPALPDVFGNYALGDFVEVVSPGDISWLPQTVGWAWLGLALLVVTLRWAWRRLLHWYRNRYRREASLQLQQLEPGDCSVSQVNRLLKLTALAAFSRKQVAPLSGQAWVDFLNEQCDLPVFDPQQAQLLAEAGYTNMPLEGASVTNLITASVAWIEQHKNPRDG